MKVHRSRPAPRSGADTRRQRRGARSASAASLRVLCALCALCWASVASAVPKGDPPVDRGAKASAAAAKASPAKAAATKAPVAKATLVTLEVLRAGKRIGTESLRTKVGAANTYHSTQAKLTDDGRAFTQRAHLILSALGALQTYDRWIDVKGATLRLRVFEAEGKWRQVVFGQPGEKNDVKEFTLASAPVIFDERSPIINGLAVLLAGDRAVVPYVRADDPSAGEATVAREGLADAAGKRFVRTTFAAKKWSIAVIADASGAILHVQGPGPLGGKVAGFDAKKLTAVAEPPPMAPAETPAPPQAPPAPPRAPPANDDAAVPPPRDEPETP